MRILGLDDMSITRERMDKGIKAVFPDAEVRYLRWPPDNVEVLNRENLKIEKNGAEAGTPPPGIFELLQQFDPQVIMAHFTPVNKAVIEAAKSLEVIGCLRGGVENINVEEATKRKIPVFNNAGRTANAVAEYTVGMMLSASRNIARGHHLIMTGKWWRPDVRPPEIYGCTVGLVGFGNIAQKVAERLKGFNVTILAYDPYVSPDILKEYNAKQVSLSELLKQADYVSLHARASAETKNLIGEAELKLMKPTAYLINTARAELVDEKALNNALKNKQIKGAALDVFWSEPLNTDDPIKTPDNVTLTPHLAGFTYETSLRTISLFLENLKEFLEKHQNRSIVNFKLAQQLEIAKGMKLAR
ncbi:MAG: 2-hydroxyacid dehydrogenase [Dehalococcoidales bacterium]|nr:2-hydroxyacid dehydrogenase [Dehalococcoidales bacterium]